MKDYGIEMSDLVRIGKRERCDKNEVFKMMAVEEQALRSEL